MIADGPQATRGRSFFPGTTRISTKVGAKIDRGLAGNKGYVLDTIKELIRDSMSAPTYRQLDSVEVFLPGDSIFLESSTTMRSFNIREASPAGHSPAGTKAWEDLSVLVRRLSHWEEWLRIAEYYHFFPQFIAVRPCFAEYTFYDETLHPGNPGASKKVNHLEALTLDSVHAIVEDLWASTEHVIPYSKHAAFISIQQAPERFRKRGRSEGTVRRARIHCSKPSILITPSTTEEEWLAMRRLIVEPNLYINLVSQDSAQPRRCSSQDDPGSKHAWLTQRRIWRQVKFLGSATCIAFPTKSCIRPQAANALG